MAIFTTKYVIQHHSPILHVYHFADGSWQFNGSEKGLKDEDYKIISLGEILEMDKSLLELEELPLGFEAIRTTIDQPWNKIASN